MDRRPRGGRAKFYRGAGQRARHRSQTDGQGLRSVLYDQGSRPRHGPGIKYLLSHSAGVWWQDNGQERAGKNLRIHHRTARKRKTGGDGGTKWRTSTIIKNSRSFTWTTKSGRSPIFPALSAASFAC